MINSFKNCAQFTDCISEINNTQIVNTKDIDIVMPMCNLIEFSNNYSKKSWSLRQFYRDDTPLTDAGVIDDFPGNSVSLKFK